MMATTTFATASMQIYPWQQPEWEFLQKRKRANHLPHALLLEGSEGVGKSAFALAFAMSLLCEAQEAQVKFQEEFDAVSQYATNLKMRKAACGVCSSCLLQKAGNHPDLFVLEPDAGNKPIIKVDQIRALINDLEETAQRGGHKIAIINMAETMNIAAANALLKTLEEPASNVIIILISSHAAMLPSTILSRCQKLVFKAPKQDIAAKWLQSEIAKAGNSGDDGDVSAAKELTFEALKILLNLSNNAPLKAVELAENGTLAMRDQIFILLESLCGGQPNVVSFAEKCSDFDLKLLLDIFFSVAHDLIKLKLGGNNAALLHEDKADLLKKLASRATVQSLSSHMNELLHAKQLLLENININKQMLIENLCLSFVL